MPAPYVVGPSASDAGSAPTRAEYRRALAAELGDFFLGTVSATPSSVDHPDADRQLLVAALGVDGQGPDYFDGAYLYVANGDEAGETRKILDGTFDGADASLLLDRPFSSPLASGTEIEVTRPLPGGRHLMTPGLNQMVDAGLGLINVEVRVPITGDGTYGVDLEPYPWIDRYEQLRGIYTTSAATGGTGTPTLSPYGYRFVGDGVASSLVTDIAFSSGETFYLAAVGRADRLVYDGDSWDYASVPGLQDDAYRGIPSVRWVVAFGATKSLEHLMRITERDDTIPDDVRERRLRDFTRRYQKWVRAAASIKANEFPRPLPERSLPMVYARRGAGWS